MNQIVGIDFGTRNSRIAAMDRRAPAIIENPEGQRSTPSCVGITETGEVLVGARAQAQISQNIENSVDDVKRILGRRYDDPRIATIRRTAPYRIVRAPNGNASVELRGKLYAPQEIAAFVFRKLKDDAERILGSPVTRAVVAVPSYFDMAQRAATIAAARIAGLEVLRTISEPNAVALSYGRMIRKTEGKHVAICDVGGGGFSVAILHIGDGVFEVRSAGGEAGLGGDDVDVRLVSYLQSVFKRDKGIDLSHDRAALRRLKEAAEIAKYQLSSASKAAIGVPFLATGKNGTCGLSTSIDRETFDLFCNDLVQRTIDTCKATITRTAFAYAPRHYRQMTVKDLDGVILVGGSTRIPIVADAVSHFFGRTPETGIQRDESVALGAAIQGGVSQGDIKDVVLLDATRFPLGIETVGGVFTRIVDRNTTMPTKSSRIFSTAENDQTTASIRVFEGESDWTGHNVLVGHLDVIGIAKARQGVPRIEVALDIDANGTLRVSAIDKGANRSTSHRVEPDSIADASAHGAQVRGALSDPGKGSAVSRRAGLMGLFALIVLCILWLVLYKTTGLMPFSRLR